MDRHVLSNGQVSAAILAQGAELCSLRDAGGAEYLWQAGPQWPRHAPLLFPVIGDLHGGAMRFGRRIFHMGRHGFARDRRFAWRETTAETCRLVLTDDPETRALFPFAFRLEVTFSLAATTLAIACVLTNPATTTLPASLGAHPAFRWPLPGAADQRAHTLQFAEPQGPTIRRLRDGLLDPAPRPSPIDGATLALDPALFDDDAIILAPVAGTSVRYAAPGGPALRVAWEGYRDLGIWSKPGSDLLCIEPWYGTADPVGFDGAFERKPGLLHLAPGAQKTFIHRITLEPVA